MAFLDFIRRLFGPRPRDDEPEAARSAPDGSERRKWPRIALDLAVKVRFASVQHAIESRTLDLSRGGAFIQMKNPRPEGTNVTIALSIGDREANLTGIVVRTVRPEDNMGPVGAGVMFSDVGAEELALLDELLAAKQAG